MAALLEIRALSVEFDTASGPLRAVDGVDLSVEAGEALAVVGESGSGKSVAMLAAMGLLPRAARVSSERMAFDGRELSGLSARERRRLVGRDMAMIFQEPIASLNPCFTVGFQIGEALRAHLGAGRAERRRETLRLLRQVGIPDPEGRLSAFPHQLSGGMCQRVMIAMAISCRPRLLVADEPTTALDVTIQAQILDLLLALRDETGMALILITHDMGVVAETAERVAVQYAGRLVEEQSAEALFAAPRHPYTAALLAALPDRAGAARRLPSIPGIVPDLAAPPPGCAFHPRCALADGLCRAEAPPRAGPEAGRALCHRPLAGPAAPGPSSGAPPAAVHSSVGVEVES